MPATKVHETTKPERARKASANGSTQTATILGRDAILAAQDVPVKTVAVPEWGGSVIVRGLTGRGRDTLEARFADTTGSVDRKAYPDFRAAYAALSMVDENGELLFSESDITALGEKSSKALQRVFNAAIALSALNPEDVDGLLEDLKADPSGTPGSD